MLDDTTAIDPVRLNSDRGSLLDENDRLRADLAEAQRQVANLEVALGTSRQIGAAIGILMSQRQLTNDEAFELLKLTSQARNVKLRDLAAEILYTGALTT